MKKRLNVIILLVCILGVCVSCFACAPKAQSEDGDTGDKKEPAGVAWSIDNDCGTCHTVENASMTDSACLASNHADQGNSCIDCHKDTEALEKVHADASADGAAKLKRLKATKVGEDVCLGCHDSKVKLAEETAGSTVLTDTQGKVVNPHALPENADHAGTICSDCHIMHKDEPIEESAPDYCLSCHHAGVYECHTCHE